MGRAALMQLTQSQNSALGIYDHLVKLGQIQEGEKFSDDIVNRHSSVLMLAARDYAISYSGTFEFMQDMQAKVKKGLSVSQSRAVLNCLLAAVRRETKAAVQAAEDEVR